MLIGSFKVYSPSAIIKVPFFAVFLWLFSLLYRDFHWVHPIDSPTPLYSALAQLTARFYYLSVFLSLLLSVLSAFWLNYIVNQHNLLSKKTYLPALFFLLYSGFSGQILYLHPAAFSNLLLIGASNELFNTYRKDSALSEAFNSGILIGFSSLLYLPSAVLFFYIIIAFIMFRPFIWREYVVSLLGFLLPWTYFVVYFFWNNRLNNLFSDLFGGFMKTRILSFPVSASYTWLYLVFGSVALVSLLRLASSQVVLPLKSKKTLSLLFWFFILALVSILLNQQVGTPSIILLAIPLSVFTSNLLLQVRKNWMSELVFSLLLIAVLIIHLNVFIHR
jgi:hypothetical protein